MVRLVDEALRSDERFGVSEGLASPDVTIVDPATGTGTYVLGIIRRIAEVTKADQGEGAVRGAVEAAVSRIIGFEIQFGPFAVAQLRIYAELKSLLDDMDTAPEMRLFVTDTLGNPYAEEEYLPQMLMPIGESRRRANEIKRQEKITVVIGNPPYKEKAKGLGGWIGAVGPAGGQGDAGVAEGVGDAGHGVEDGRRGLAGSDAGVGKGAGVVVLRLLTDVGGMGHGVYLLEGLMISPVREVRGEAGRSRLPPPRCCWRSGAGWWTAAPARAGP